MALAAITRTVQDGGGNAVAGASVEIRSELGGAPLATLFSDRAGTIPLGNPFVASAAQWTAYMVEGRYRLDVTQGGSTATERDVVALEGLGSSGQIETASLVATTTISVATSWFRTLGYSDVGDGGAALYVRVGSEPSHPLKLQSLDGAWWEIAESTIKPQMAGADPTATADSTTALNNVLSYIRSQNYAPGFLSPTTVLGRKHYIDGAGGIFKILGSLNATGIVLGRNWGIRNMVIDAHCSGKVALDLTGSRFGHFSDIHIWGDQTDVPWTGIQLARESDGAGGDNPCSLHNFSNVFVDGYFLQAAFHNYAAEQIYASHSNFWNRRVGDGSGPSYAAILDGSKTKTVLSDFTTFPAAARKSFTVNQYVHCSFQKPFAISGPTMYVQDPAHLRFDQCYITNGSGICIEWLLTATFNPYAITMDVQIETTGNQTFIEFRTDVAASQRKIDRLHCDFGGLFTTDQVFKINSALNLVTLSDFECLLPYWVVGAPTNKVFDLPAKVAIYNGRILVPAYADMNAPSTLSAFTGTITDVTGIMVVRSLGTTTNDNAPAGCIGEEIATNVLLASAVALTTATPANVMSISLPPGDYEVSAQIVFDVSGTTNWTELHAGVNSTSATLPTLGGANRFGRISDIKAAGALTATDPAYSINTSRFSLSVTTTVFLVAQATFSAGAVGAYGFLRARRIR